MRSLEFRIGIPETSGRFLIEAKERGYKVMVSASRFWKAKHQRFIRPGKRLIGLDVFLDSAGFTAMRHWGGYPWSAEEYLTLVSQGTWTHWSQMDYCCEPEVAGNEPEILSRLDQTAAMLGTLTKRSEDLGLKRPLPVLQGWTPAHYRRSADLADSVLKGAWPDLVGVGSVCRRQVKGPAGILSIVQALDTHLPPHVRLHLFGVKSESLGSLQKNPRVVSADSMAWDIAVRWECRKTSKKYNMDNRIKGMHQWMSKQIETLSDTSSSSSAGGSTVQLALPF